MSSRQEILSKMSKYIDLLKEVEIKTTELHNSLGLFFAFNNKQFEEGKIPLIEGDVYVHIGGNGYCPKLNAQSLINGIECIIGYKREQVLKEGLEEAEVLYALRNYECFYSYDIDSALNALSPTYTMGYILEVFNKHVEEESELESESAFD